MSRNYTAAIDYWGFRCPKGGRFYICENSWIEFFGCCDDDPCSDGTGICQSGVKPLSLDPDHGYEMPLQSCLSSSTNDYYVCWGTRPPFVGCCGQQACGNGCPASELRTAVLSPDETRRRNLFYPPSLSLEIPPSLKTPLEAPSTTLPSSFRNVTYDAKSSRNSSLMTPPAVAGMCSAILIAILICIGLFARHWKQRPAKAGNAQTYSQIRDQGSDGNGEDMRPSPTPSREEAIIADFKSQSEPRKLKQADFTTFIVWVWNIVLTLVPLCFIALAVVVVNLDGQMKSSFGQHVLELTKLSPSLYPILFAAVVGRFYKNLARYCLEQSGGVRLAVLEQVFGSQSFATALERVFFVHTHIFLSVIILTTWALSPLGGQSSSRILGFGNATEVANGTVNYLHPAYQVSSYLARRPLLATRASVAALYSSNLLSSLEQKRSPRDMWELPKIPQVTSDYKKVGKAYMVDQKALESGDDHYASLLGVKLRGLGSSQEATEHNFTVQTSYIDLDCELTDYKFDLDTDYWKNKTTSDRKGEGAYVDVQCPVPWEEWNESNDPPALELTYFIRWERRREEYDSRNYWAAINCTMQTVWLETNIHCGPQPTSTSCYAYQQRRINSTQHPNRPPRLMRKRFGALQQALGFWPEASGDSGFEGPQATENYIMGELHPYAGQDYRDWGGVGRRHSSDISRRLTTAFNTFWDATLNPLGHTNVSFGALNSSNTTYEDEFNPEPFMNATVGTMTRTFEVYRASQLWVAILLTATMILQIFAILGLVLEAVIVGPEVLGFASSLTRDNRYVPVPAGNSALDGPERARAFGDLRLQLADVEPGQENGYIAVHALQNDKVEKVSRGNSEGQVAADEVSVQVDTRPLCRERLYR
ncbi:hypothetical protein NW768_012037 [Fusarium equiseti]|uniref:Uncharacterized protein n=1 Tax=Fusarium equiseti TaxID=61235 RepID=A0ABQ8QW86_FUSEQ|nr:hypothetical protein NW768_012037 [Fusarium equiseti]